MSLIYLKKIKFTRSRYFSTSSLMLSCSRELILHYFCLISSVFDVPPSYLSTGHTKWWCDYRCRGQVGRCGQWRCPFFSNLFFPHSSGSPDETHPTINRPRNYILLLSILASRLFPPPVAPLWDKTSLRAVGFFAILLAMMKG